MDPTPATRAGRGAAGSLRSRLRQWAARRIVIVLVVVLAFPAASVALMTADTLRLPRLLSSFRASLLSCTDTALVLPPFTVNVLLATVLLPLLSFSVMAQLCSLAGQARVNETAPFLLARSDFVPRSVTSGLVLSLVAPLLPPPCVLPPAPLPPDWPPPPPFPLPCEAGATS